MQYTIIRVYRVPAESQIQATNRFLESVELGVEHDYLVRDYVKGPDGKPEQVFPLRTVSWWTLIKWQLLGR